jgi:hypothetical protein
MARGVAEPGHGRFLATASLVRLGVGPGRLVHDLALPDDAFAVVRLVLESPCLEGVDRDTVGQARITLSAVALSVSVVIPQSFPFGLEGESALYSSACVSPPYHP